ncbi:hypothetical protein AAG906_007575 [Vitis piasezkii]
MVASGSIETIDRSILWKKAREKKDGTFDEVAIPVIEKIYSGRVRAKGKHYTPHQYFNTSKEEQRIFQAEVLAKLTQVGVVTPQSDVSSSNMKQKQLLLPEAVDKPIRKVEDVTPPEAIEPQKKFYRLENVSRHGTKENIVAGGTIILECGPNYLVVVDAPYDSGAPFPFLFWTNYYSSKKAKKQKVNEVEVKSKGENHKI